MTHFSFFLAGSATGLVKPFFFHMHHDGGERGDDQRIIQLVTGTDTYPHRCFERFRNDYLSTQIPGISSLAKKPVTNDDETPGIHLRGMSGNGPD